MNLLLQSRHKNSEHIETGLVKTRPFAQLLHDLHEHFLSIDIATGLVRLGQAESNLVAVRHIELLDNVERAFAQRLSDRIEEDKNEVGNVAEPENGRVHVERILHVAVDETGRVDERHQAELLLLARRDLRAHVVQAVLDVHEAFHLRVQVNGRVAQQWLAFLSACH